MDDELLGVDEASAFFNVSKDTFNKMSKRDGFPAPLNLNKRTKAWTRYDLREWAGLATATTHFQTIRTDLIDATRDASNKVTKEFENRTPDEITEIVRAILAKLTLIADRMATKS